MALSSSRPIASATRWSGITSTMARSPSAASCREAVHESVTVDSATVDLQQLNHKALLDGLTLEQALACGAGYTGLLAPALSIAHSWAPVFGPAYRECRNGEEHVRASGCDSVRLGGDHVGDGGRRGAR